MEREINAIKMTRTIREKHYNLLKNKSKQEIIQFFREKTQAFNRESKKMITK